MTDNKFLNGNIFAHNFSDDERSAVLKLRECNRKLTRAGRLALASTLLDIYSSANCGPLGRLTATVILREFSTDLANAVLQVFMLSPTSQLAIAIELLEAERDSQKC